jgi:hypothetical protein
MLSRRDAMIAAGLLLASGPLTPAAHAIVVANGDAMPEPTNGYVGAWNGSSAVCIAPNWIISAKHVGGAVGQYFTMRGQQYRAVEIQTHATQDVQLIRVAETLPGYHALATGVEAGDLAILGGWGRTNGVQLSNGYDWTGPRRETWGANIIEAVGSQIMIRFDNPTSPSAVPHEATFAINDSGAGLFIVGPDGSLQLAGIAVSVTGFGQSAYGSLAFSVSMEMMRTWIQGIAPTNTVVGSSVPAPRASLFGSGAPSIIWAGGVLLGLAAARRRR